MSSVSSPSPIQYALRVADAIISLTSTCTHLKSAQGNCCDPSRLAPFRCPTMGCLRRSEYANANAEIRKQEILNQIIRENRTSSKSPHFPVLASRTRCKDQATCVVVIGHPWADYLVRQLTKQASQALTVTTLAHTIEIKSNDKELGCRVTTGDLELAQEFLNAPDAARNSFV